MQDQYVESLRQFGDVVERLGVNDCGLGEKFPRYAEFWCKHVLTNRRPNDYTKLGEHVKPEVEDIINNHYGVYHQLTIGYFQLKNYPNPLIDFSTPLYHFGGAADLIERTFLSALRANSNNPFHKFDQAEIDQQISEFLKNYDNNFKTFEKSLRPVSLTFHNVEQLLIGLFPAWKNYKPIFDRVRHYRNILIHSLSPLRLRNENGVILIPKEDRLNKYSNGNAKWSSGNWDESDYAPAQQIIRELADELVNVANEAWVYLLLWMDTLDPQDNLTNQIKAYQNTPHEYEESGGVMVRVGSRDPYIYSGGTLTVNDWRASGIHPIPPTSGFD